MQKTDTNLRRDFIKKISIAMASIGALSFFKFKKSTTYSEKKYSTLSRSEAEEIIKSEKFAPSTHLKPSPAPFSQKG